MRWGKRRWGDSRWGASWATNLRSVEVPTLPPQALLLWEPRGPHVPATVVWQVYVNGRLHDTTADTQLLVVLPQGGRFFWEVHGVLLGDERDDLRGELAPVPGDRIKLTWDPRPMWGAFRWGGSHRWGSDAGLYRIYWDEGVGTSPLVLLAETGRTYHITDALAAGTYVFRIDPIDRSGNQLTSTTTISVVHVTYPAPPSEFHVTGYDAPSTTFSAAWVESPTAGVTAYAIYSNGGDGPIDYVAPVATIAAPATSGSWVEAATAGSWTHAIRAMNTTYTEDNVTQVHAYEMAGAPLGVLGLQPATPINFSAAPIAGGQVILTLDYPAATEGSLGVAIRVYSDGGTGTIDYVTPLHSEDIPAHDLGESRLIGVPLLTPALTHGTAYKFAARAVDAAGRESASTPERVVRADAEPPGEVTMIRAEPVLGLPVLEGFFDG